MSRTMDEAFFSVRNWQRFQHYKKRSPPWIKHYTALLNDREFRALTPTARDLLRDLWLLAAVTNNAIPCDLEWISWQLRVASAALATPLTELLSGCWFEGNTVLLASLVQGTSKALDRDRGETETEQRREKQTAAAATPFFDSLSPDGQQAYTRYRTAHRLPVEFDARLAAIGPGGIRAIKGATWDTISNALASMAGNGERFNEARLRGYIAKDLEREAGW